MKSDESKLIKQNTPTTPSEQDQDTPKVLPGKVLTELQAQNLESKPELKTSRKNPKTPIAIITIPARTEPTKCVMFDDKLEEKESKNTSSSASFEKPAKRSKSEASKAEEELMVIMHKARKNLLKTRKLSPNKLDAQIRQRQERAENLRQSILATRREYLEKVRQR